MLIRPHRRSASVMARTTIVLAVIGACAVAVAYAASGRAPARPPAGQAALARTGAKRPPLARITAHPEKLAGTPAARFAFKVSRGKPGFQCRLDGATWKSCRSPLALGGLRSGEHSFSVRAVVGRRRGRAASYYWTVVEPKPIAVEPQTSTLAPLFPGAPAQAVPVILRNPNSAPVSVTAVSLSAAADPSGCDSDNFELSPAGISVLAPLVIPAGGAVSLPAPGAGAPTIALRDLPFDQDACQGAQLPLLFSAEARG
jgi:hypothetical protein